MEPVPREFFTGLMDFFSILLPGALLTYLLMDEMGPIMLRDQYAKLATQTGCASECPSGCRRKARRRWPAALK